MEMKLYQTLDNENVINKELTLKYTINITLKNGLDISNPMIILNDKNTMNFNDCNYCYLDEFKRFYFIRSIENMNNHNWRLSLECDVLESFKNDILGSFAEYKRNVQNGDYLEFSGISDVRKEIDIFESDVTLNDMKEIILSTMGGV